MSSKRSKLKLDEQSFETLLAAAYTVQQHNAKRKRASIGQGTCSQCGGLLEPDHQFCCHCGARRDEFRPGERMQRNWASLWMMSQKHGAAPDVTGAKPESTLTSEEPRCEAENLHLESSEPVWADEELPEAEEIQAEANDLDLHSLLLPSVESAGELATEDTESAGPRAWNLRLVLRFHRGDLYLALAILVSALAISWVIWGAPLAKAPQLSVGERTLVKLGLAEAPDRPVTYRGNPSARVWADPHTALYYCDGDEQFGKTRGGHFSTQREAQLDRFSPAARMPCQ